MDSSNKPHFGQFLADAPRLSSGHICSLLLIYFWWDALERDDQGWSNKTTLSHLSQYCHTKDTKAVEGELDDIISRGLAEIQHFDLGEFSVRLKMEDWEALPDYSGKGPVR